MADKRTIALRLQSHTRCGGEGEIVPITRPAQGIERPSRLEPAPQPTGNGTDIVVVTLIDDAEETQGRLLGVLKVLAATANSRKWYESVSGRPVIIQVEKTRLETE